MKIRIYTSRKGQTLVELLFVIGLAAIILPALLFAFVTSRQGRVQNIQRQQAVDLMRSTQDEIRSIREKGWSYISTPGVYYPVVSGSSWSLSSGSQTTGDFTRQLTISDVYRASASGAISSTGGYFDPSTKRIDISITWNVPYGSSLNSTLYVTRYLDNLSYLQTTQAEFNTNTLTQTKVTNTAGGEVTIADNTKAKWCAPSFSSSTIDLPDGPPVAVSANANASSGVPNDVVVATAPTATSSVKLAYVNVTANTDPPVSTLKGIFTLDSAQYSSPSAVPSGIGLTNSFRTNDVKYYKAPSGKIYALMATDLPDREIVVVQLNNGTTDAYQDATNKIYKYWTYFNTKMYGSAFNNPSAHAAETTNAGDNNGFASNPTNAYANDGSYAVDTDSGNNTGTSCTGNDKDKHRFYNYNFSVPSGATISGIEVNLSARVDSATGSPQMCVQLSWDGGTTWTTAKTTSTLTTTNTTYTLGGPTDTWGRSWSDSNFTNTNFRLRIINVASNTSRDFSLDWVGAKVYHNGSSSSTNDQAPFGYGAKALTILGSTAYTASGGYLYAFDLTNIDTKSATDSLDQVGCRIQLDGYDCNPGSGTDRKYSSGETGGSWSDTTSPAHNDCSDGGNIELNATNHLSGVQVGGSNYIYVAVGAGTNPEFEIVNATSVPTSGTTPSISSTSCGRISGGNSAWKVVGTYDFNSDSGTEEAANSVYAKSDGSRAYISSNGGVDADGDGQPDSKQFYILNTSTKTAPAFLSGSPSTGPGSGYYYGGVVTPTPAGPAYHNEELYPRRSLTVLNGQRAVLVGKDGVSNAFDPEEYQVLNLATEATPAYCGGVSFNSGFNDLTSVTEADFDTYVYMVANTTLNELKIIQGGPDGAYLDQGSSESLPIDAGYSTAFNSYAATVTTPANTSVQFQFAGADPVSGSCNGATYTFIGPDGTSGTYYTATTSALLLNDDGSGYENPARCFKYKAYLSTTDYNATPILRDMTINYSP